MNKHWVLMLVVMLAALMTGTVWAGQDSGAGQGFDYGQSMEWFGSNYEHGIGVAKEFDTAIFCYEKAKNYYESVGDFDKVAAVEKKIERVRQKIAENPEAHREQIRRRHEKYFETERELKRRNKSTGGFGQGLMIMLAASIGVTLANLRKSNAQTTRERKTTEPEWLRKKEDPTAEWIRNLEEQGNTASQNDPVTHSANDSIVKNDEVKPAQPAPQPVEQNDVSAKKDLSVSSRENTLVKKVEDNARSRFLEVANRDDVKELVDRYSLISYYFNGEDVNKAKVKKWFQNEANRGNEDARKALALFESLDNPKYQN